MYIAVLLFNVTKKLAQPNPSNQAFLKALFSGKLVDSPWSLSQTPWRWTTPEYWQKPSSIQVKLTRKTNCPFIHCWGFWCWILNAVRCIMRMLFYIIDWVIKFRSWKKKIDVYTDRMNQVEKCSFYFVSREVLYLSCTAGKIISVRCNTCLMEIIFWLW